MADDPFTARSPFRPSHQPGRPKPRAVGRNEVRVRTRHLHGYRFAYRMAGKGESAVVLIHGIGDSSATWADVIPGLAARHRVVAPDLLGHGASAKPRGDYSPGAYANGLRDLLSALGIERATLVGHSLGGAVAASSPTSSRSAPSGWSWSAAEASDARSPRCCGPPPCPAPNCCSRPCNCPRCAGSCR